MVPTPWDFTNICLNGAYMGEGTIKHSKRSNTQYCQIVLFAMEKQRVGKGVLQAALLSRESFSEQGRVRQKWDRGGE